jgi:hypothetical protein
MREEFEEWRNIVWLERCCDEKVAGTSYEEQYKAGAEAAYVWCSKEPVTCPACAETFDMVQMREATISIDKDLTKKDKIIQRLKEGLEFIRDNPNYGQYHDGSSELKAKQTLSEVAEMEGGELWA